MVEITARKNNRGKSPKENLPSHVISIGVECKAEYIKNNDKYKIFLRGKENHKMHDKLHPLQRLACINPQSTSPFNLNCKLFIHPFFFLSKMHQFKGDGGSHNHSSYERIKEY